MTDTRVTPQRWLWVPRTKPIRMIEIHATRGNTTPEKQMSAALNWVLSPNNGGPVWGSSFSHVIGTDGSMGTVLDDNQMPTYSAGYGGAGSTYAIDEYAISYELAQSQAQEPFSDAIYARLAKEVALDCQRHGIPVKMIAIPRQTGTVPTGIVRHDKCENGIKLGKTDPGGQFNEARFITDVKAEMEDEMLDETADYITFERMFQKAWRKSLVKVLDKDREEVGDAHPPGRWAGVGSETRTALNTHTGDASKHSGQGGYTDAQAVKAVKDKL